MRSADSSYPEIQIDDAGWGDLIGGVVLGGYDVVMRAFRWAVVPVEHFQGEAFEKKSYLSEARRAVIKLLGDLRADKRFHAVALCTSYVLTEAARSLRKNGWKVVRRQIEGRCQELVEERYRKELIKLGVPSRRVRNVPSGSNRFYQLFEWVKEDPESREQFVKTGWKSWPTKWRLRLYAC
jgi:hypothetical protein